MVIALILLGVLLSVAGQTCLKAGMNRMGAVSSVVSKEFLKLPLAVLKQPFILAGAPLYISAAFVWLLVLSKVDLSYAYPFLGLNYVLVALVSGLFLGERVDGYRWTGVGVILLGVIVMGRYG